MREPWLRAVDRPVGNDESPPIDDGPDPAKLQGGDAAARPLIGAEVAEALRGNRPVVALETTIFSDLGLPPPANRQALDRVLAMLRSGSAVPALTAVLDGRLRVGLDEAEHDVVCGPTTKVAARDLGVAVAKRLGYGATTVSASLAIAAAAGLEVFSTGGIGGVHRGWAASGDISSDLTAVAANQVITVSAGAKVFLDLPATLEHLETLSVPVIGWQCDEFPAFHAPSSGIALPVRADSAAEVAAIARSHWALGGGGLLVVAPVPEADGIPFEELMEMVDHALGITESLAISGAAVTPAVLAQLREVSDGRTVDANLSLAENNAKVAAEIAGALCDSAVVSG